MLNQKIYDLHCHSNQSDGILSPEALVSRAKERDVSVLALTDHDTIAGIERARHQAAIEGIELISGVEFSTQWKNRNIHVVGLNVDTESESLALALKSQHSKRKERALMIADKLAREGFEGIYDEALAISGGEIVGRPHFAKALIARGAVSSMDQAFKRWLGNGKVGDVKQIWPELSEMVEAIVAAKGTAVLAHPAKYKITRTKLCELIEDFMDAGGKAIEVISGNQNVQETTNLARLARKYQLQGSCGSDFHAPDVPWAELGKMPAMPDDIEPVWHSWAS